VRFISKLALILSAIAYGATAFAIPRLDIDLDTTMVGIQGSRVIGIGDVIDVAIEISGVTGLYAYDIDVDNNNVAAAGATGISEGAFLPSGGATLFAPGALGNPVNALAVLLGAPSGVSGSGTLFTIQYTALATGISSLSFRHADLADDLFETIAVELGGARLIVRDAPLPSTLCLFGIGLVVIGGLRRRLR
jgi:hypothetical protein